MWNKSKKARKKVICLLHIEYHSITYVRNFVILEIFIMPKRKQARLGSNFIQPAQFSNRPIIWEKCIITKGHRSSTRQHNTI